MAKDRGPGCLNHRNVLSTAPEARSPKGRYQGSVLSDAGREDLFQACPPTSGRMWPRRAPRAGQGAGVCGGGTTASCCQREQAQKAEQACGPGVPLEPGSFGGVGRMRAWKGSEGWCATQLAWVTGPNQQRWGLSPALTALEASGPLTDQTSVCRSEKWVAAITYHAYQVLGSGWGPSKRARLGVSGAAWGPR